MSTDPPSGGPRKAPLIVLRREPGIRAGLSALLRGRCPRCRRGPIFTRVLRMTPECAVCGLHFEREPGYFTGAMYVSYLIALPIFVALYFLVLRFMPALRFALAIGLTVALFLPFVPIVFRVSRILWIHFDRAIDADES